MERDGAVRGIWSGTGPGLCPSGPAGRTSRHFTTPRGLVFFSFLRPSRRSFAAAAPPRPGASLPSNRGASWPRPLCCCHGSGTSVVRVWRPLAAGRAQYKAEVWESLPGTPFVFDQRVSAPGKPRHLYPTSLSGSQHRDRIPESIRLGKTSKLIQSNL